MSNRQVIILKGVSSAGKSSVAKLFPNSCICTADDFFTRQDGTYHFDQTLIGRAHNDCRWRFDQALKDESIENIIIVNTNVAPSHWIYYADRAKENGLKVFHLVIEKWHTDFNDHNVPLETLKKQENTLKQNLKLR